MNGITPRSYNCKDEELPIVCGFVAISLERDLNDFAHYSPVFDSNYVVVYNEKINVVQELIQPKSETVELKLITEHTYSTLNAMIEPINHVEGYLQLASKTVPISASDFGTVQLRKSIRKHDVENVLMQLRTVNANLAKYKNELMAKGLTDTLMAKFAEGATLLADDKKKKFAVISNRAALVQNNQSLLNELYDQMTEICNIGKVLYKLTDKAKLKDYTFTHLMKQVRRKENKPTDPEPPEKPATE